MYIHGIATATCVILITIALVAMLRSTDARATRRACGSTRRSDIGRDHEGLFEELIAKAKTKRGKKQREEMGKVQAEMPKIQQYVTDEERESIPEVGDLTRRSKEAEGRVVPDMALVGDRSKGECESSLELKAEIGDIKRARMLFDSLVKSNPKYAPGKCSISLLYAKVVLANAMATADLEHNVKAKKRAMRKVLEHIPTSVCLWKETVNLETSTSDARIHLAHAVEVIPSAVELWLALARLETPNKAKGVIHKALWVVPTSHEIWVAAARLLEQEALCVPDENVRLEDSVAPKPTKTEEERNKALEVVDKTLEVAFRELRKHQAELTKEQWLKEAERCEVEGSLRTCEVIVKATTAMGIDVGIDDKDKERLDIWMADAESCKSRGRVGTARVILAYALRVYPARRRLWRQAVDLEKTHGLKDSLDAILARATQHCPEAEVVWLMIHENAAIANKESEAIQLAVVKLEAENGELAAAAMLLERARSVVDTQRVWMNPQAALQKFPKASKLYTIQAQVHLLHNNILAARGALSNGVNACPRDPRFWVLASWLEEIDGKSTKARALLEKGRLVVSKRDRKEKEEEEDARILRASEMVWAESVWVEERAANVSSSATKATLTLLSFALNLALVPPLTETQSKSMLARALQGGPSSGILWSLAIFSENRPQRKSKPVDALKKSGHDAVVRKIEKAHEWFGRASQADPNWGEVWGCQWWLVFEKKYTVEEHQEAVQAQCAAAQPRYLPVWQAIAKDD
ncbi:hypothetical protein BKA70DRAFT_1373001 [Coprinopsis sp. MPI-PUGE-AT-0042]|nr:hypothetical protein BKA70DRAFT_1373001 [Coprinopsis sp. MPI-PUGE-AT-0042]